MTLPSQAWLEKKELEVSSQCQMHIQSHVWDPGSQIQPWAGVGEEFGSWDSSGLVSRLFFPGNLQLELFLGRVLVWICKDPVFLLCTGQNWFLKWSRNSFPLAPTPWQNHKKHQIMPSDDLEIKRVPCSVGFFFFGLLFSRNRKYFHCNSVTDHKYKTHLACTTEQ